MEFRVTEEMIGSTLRKRRTDVVVRGAFNFGMILAVEPFLIRRPLSYFLTPSVLALNGLALVACALLTWHRFSTVRDASGFLVIVDEESIRAVYGSHQRIARNGKIRTIRQTKPHRSRVSGLLISEYGAFGAFVRGGVWIPETFPDYQQLKESLARWCLHTPR